MMRDPSVVADERWSQLVHRLERQRVLIETPDRRRRFAGASSRPRPLFRLRIILGRLNRYLQPDPLR